MIFLIFFQFLSDSLYQISILHIIRYIYLILDKEFDNPKIFIDAI